MLTIGLINRKKIKSASDFVLGGHRLGGWLAAFAYGTTYFSAVVFIGYGGSVSWQYGISSIWIGIGNAVIGTLMAWLLLGRRTYDTMNKYDAQTMPEYFSKRFDSRLLRKVAAVITFLFLIPYSASVYAGLGILFESVFGVQEWVLVICMGVLTAVYLTLGGYLAAAVNDLIQGIIMLAGITVVVIMVVTNPAIGGISGGLETLAQQSTEGVNLASPFSFSFNLICLIVMTSLGTWGLPQMAHKFHAVKSVSSIKKATVISTIFALIIGGGSYFMGSFGRVYMNGVMPEAGGDYVVPQILQSVLGGDSILNQALFAIIAVVVLSASMSTLSSIVLTSSSAIALDLTDKKENKMSGKKSVLLLRALCIVFIGISVALTLNKIDAIVNLMSYSWGALSGAFIGPYVLSLFWKGVNKYGAFASIIWAVTFTLLGVFKVFKDIPWLAPAPNIGAIAIVGSFAVTLAVSLIFKNKVQKNESAAQAA